MNGALSIRVQLANSIIRDEKWENSNIREIGNVKTLKEAAYRAVRETHDFLTDSNHTWSGGRKSIMWGGKKIVFYSITISRNEESPKPVLLGFGADLVDYWFAVEYRRAPISNLERQAA